MLKHILHKYRFVLVLVFIALFAVIGFILLHQSHAANADINADNKVNISDLSIVALNWGLNNRTFSQGDITGDHIVNILDLSVLAGGWGYPLPVPANVCANAPTGNKINTVIVIAEENRTWTDAGGSADPTPTGIPTNVGGVGFSAMQMPYTHNLASKCGYFQKDTEVAPLDSSAQQYIGAWTGFDYHTSHVVSNCTPSPTCSYTGNNIFRAFRTANIPHHQYIENATTTCSISYGIPYAIVPDLYMWNPIDTVYCPMEVVPLTNFNFTNPAPGFSFITPTLINDGHNSNNSTVDQWLADPSHLPALFNSTAYKSGKVLVELWWDEDAPRPNLFACWSCKHFVSTIDPHYSGESLLWLNLLGAPSNNLGAISNAVDIRPILGTP